MVAIVSGNSLGLSLTSLGELGQLGTKGNAAHGRSGESAYVNVANGNLVLQTVDDWLVGRGEDIALLRTYNSQGLMTDDNGDNWSLGTFQQQMKLTGTVMTAGSTITRTGRDGSQAIFHFDPALQVYVSRDGGGPADGIFYYDSESRFVWTDGDSLTSEIYEESTGRLVLIADQANNTTQYYYNSNGTLAAISTANGEGTVFQYSGTNLTMVEVMTSNGTKTRTRYSYDANNRLASVTVDLSPDDNSIADGKTYTTTYTYDGTSKRVASISQTDGTSLTFTYVVVGGENRVATVTDAQARVTSYSYDTTNRRTTVTDSLGLSTTYAYNASGQLTQITGPAVGGVSQIQSFTYDADGNVATVVDAENRTTVFEYNWQGLPTLERDAAGNTVKRTYGGSNEMLTETVHLVPDPDGAGSGQPSVPLTTRFAYTGQLPVLLRFAVSPEGRVTEHQYNSFGQRIATIEYTGALFSLSGYAADQAPSEYTLATWAAGQNKTQTTRTDMAYDVRGQLQSVTRFAKVNSSGAGISDGSQSTTQYVYGQSGELLQVVDAKGGSTVYTYDGMGRQLSVQDAAGHTTLSTYDDNNRKTSVTQANGLVVTSTYDSAGRLVSVMRTDGASTSFGATEYFYDANGRLRMTQDPTGVRNWILYDAAGRKAADIDADGSVTEYFYNKNNQVTRTIAYATAIDVSALVDGGGQPVDVALAAIRPSSSGQDQSRWFAYDSANRLVKTVNALGVVTTTTYDGASRVVATTTHANPISTASLGNSPSASSIAPTTSADDRTQRNLYDKDGLLVATLDAEGYLTEFGHDHQGRIIRSTAYATATPAQYRASGTLAQLRPAPHAGDVSNHFLLDGKGQIVGQIDAEGYLTENVYDANGNVTQSVRYATTVAPSAIAALTATSTVSNVRPASHASDRVVTRTYDQLNRTSQETNAEGTVTQFSYDSLGRLVSTSRAASTTDVRTLLVQYDLLGRVTGELSAEGAALLTGGQSQTEIDAIWAQHGTSHTYDAAGRRTSTTDAAGNRTLFFYDADDRLTHSINALGETTENQYNALGQLVTQVRFGTRVDISGLTGSQAGGLVNSLLNAAIDAIRNNAIDSKLVYTYDQAGLTSSVTDANGYVTSFTYNAFGEEISRTQAIGGGQQLVQTRSYDKRGLLTSDVLDPSGVNAITTAIYDAFGRVLSSTDALGRVHQKSYDRLGRVVTDTDPLSAVRSTSYDAFDRVLTRSDALGKVTTYSYSDAARSVIVTTPEGVSVTTVRNRHGQTQSVTDGLGNTTNYAYDRNGQLLSSTTPLTTSSNEYDNAGRLSQTVDANGNVVILTYDAANRLLTRTVDPGGLNLVTTYSYDAKGQQISVTDPNGVVTALAYDLKGQLVQQTVDPGGLELVTEYTYDGRGKTLLVTRPEGTEVLYVYDKLGRRIEERIDPFGLNLARGYAYDAKGNVTSATDANGGVTRYAYDGNDRLIYTVDPLGNVRHTAYDAEGRVAKTVAYATPISTAGLTAATTVAQIQALIVSDPSRDLIEHRVLDDDGRLLASVNGLGEVVKYAYDANGNVIARLGYSARIDMQAWVVGTDPTPVTDVARDQYSRTVYDELNRALYTVDGVGAVVAYTYDANGNVVDRIAHATPIPTSTAPTAAAIEAAVALIADEARDSRTRMGYDAANRLVWEANGVGAVTQRIYDKNGNLAKTIQYAATIDASQAPSSVTPGANDRVTAFVHDSANRLTFTIDALGHLTQLSYDGNGNVKQRIEYATALTVPTAASEHDLSVTESAAAGVRSLSNDRVSHAFFDAADRLVIEVDALGGVRERVYDAAGNRIQDIRYATRISTTTLSATSTTASVRSAIVTDANVDRSQRFAYDAAGRLAYAIDGSGYVTRSTFDGLGLVTSTTRFTLTVPGSVANNVGAIAAAIVAVPSTDQTDSFAYDAAGRLLATTDAHGKTESHTYDGLGRKVTFTNKLGNVWTYEHDSAGRMTRETSPEVALSTTTAGSNGSLIASSTTASVVTVLGYDALGNLTSRTEAHGRPEARTTQYEYDALGRQVRSVFHPVGVYNAAEDELATNGATTTATRVEDVYSLYSEVTYDAFGNAIANRDVAGAMSFKAYDKLGRVRYDVDALGYVTEYELNTWGQATTTTRFSAKTTLLSGSPASLSSEQIHAAVYPSGGNHATDRKLITEYDRLGQTSAVREPSRFTYDSTTFATGNAEKLTSFQYNAFGELTKESVRNNISVTDSANHTNRYYDQRGLEVARVDALGYLTTQEHDSWGNLASRTEFAAADTNWDGVAPTPGDDDRRTAFTYDKLNRKVLERRENVEFTASAKSTVIERGDVDTAYTYDDLGNTTSVTDANGGVTYTYYDALGRVTAIAAPGLTIDSIVKMPLTTFQRDAHGNVIVKVDHANGASAASVTSFTQGTASSADRVEMARYDSHGHVVQTVDANGSSRHTSYNARGQVAKEWQAVTDANGVTKTIFTAYKYDAVGNQTHIITPATTEVFAGGINNLGYTSATVYPIWSMDSEESRIIGYQVTGTNSVSMSWPDLVDGSGGLVRVQVSYNTLSTLLHQGHDEGVPIYVGVAPYLTSRTWDVSASSALNGFSASWSETNAPSGGISSIAYIRVWQQAAGGAWEMKWEGAASQTNGSGIVTVTQAQAGVDETRMEYNAFGEMTRRGINGGRQEYFDYYNSGELWRTNSGDGADKVFLYDVQGNKTAEILSGGTTNLLNFATAQDVSYLGSNAVRRTEYVYDQLGRVVSQKGPERLETHGGVSVSSGYAGASFSTAQFAGASNENGSLQGGYWSGTNSISAWWAPLDSLGSGEVMVTVDYVTRGYGTIPYHTTDENGNPLYDESGQPIYSYTHGYTSGVATSSTRVVTAEQGNSGISWSWTEPWGYQTGNVTGGVAGVSRVRVWKKNLTGHWVSVVDQSSFGYQGTHMDVAAPADPNTTVVLQMRLQGTTTWIDRPLVKYDNAYRFNATGMGAGNWEYRVQTTKAGQTQPDGQPLVETSTSGVVTMSGGFLSHVSSTGATTTSARPVINQTLDRWGNVLVTNDARSKDWKTTFRYNANNQVVEQRRPDVQGAQSTNSPVTSIFYDKLGRQVTSVDANGNVSGQKFDSLGNLEQEQHADGGNITYTYSLFGDKVRKVDALGYVTNYNFDKLSQLLQTSYATADYYVVQSNWGVTHFDDVSITETNTWDQAGRKLTQTNGNSETLTYHYDLQGNLLRTVFPLSTSARSIFNAQGYKTVEVDANGNTNTWKYDYFGKVIGHTDLGNNRYSYTYNAARQLVSQTNTLGASKTYTYDRAGQLVQISDAHLNQVTKYAYDLAGNRVQESTTKAGVVYQDNHLAYDTLGRLRWVADSRAIVEMDYDKAGNRTRIKTHVINGTTNYDSDRYFQYDSMNRQIRVDVDQYGNLGAQGRSITYDLNGNRTSETFNGSKVNPSNYAVTSGTVSETYQYDALNRLTSVTRDGTVIDRRMYDKASRVVQSGGTLAAGYYAALYGPGVSGTGSEVKLTRYDQNGRTLAVHMADGQGNVKYTVHYSSYDAAGNLLGYTVQNYQGTAYTNNYYYTLLHRDAYKESVISGNSTVFTPGTTTNTYDANSHLVAVNDSGNSANNRSFVNDDAGRVLYKNQNGAVERQLIANGEVLGRFGGALADFNFSYRPISASFPTANPGTYAVSANDSLRSIAQAVYGDSSLWYLIADANGVANDKELRVGQTLNLPNRVTGAANNAGTFKPYDPSVIVGDTTPTLPSPPPPKKGGCGGLGQLIMIVVAVVATIYTAGALTAGVSGGFGATMSAGVGVMTGSTTVATGFAASVGLNVTATAALAGAVGSIASQVAGNMLGVVDGFSWQSVALSALGAGVTSGVGQAITSAGGSLAGSTWQAAAGRAALGNALTQGVGVITGLQDKFDWRGVAASAVGAGVGHGVGEALRSGNAFSNFGRYADLARNTATGMVAGTAAAVMRGGKVVVQQIATDAFGNALGSSLAAGSTSASSASVPVEHEDNDSRYRLPGQYVQSDNAEPVTSGAAPVYEDNDSHYQLPGSYVTRDNPDVAVSVKAGVYGGSMERVARSMLGANASQRDINNYVGQLLEINGINDPRRVQAGQDILLPDASTPAATKGQAIYGKDIALGEQMKVEAAQAQRERWDAMQTGAWSGRTDPGGPVWHVGGSEGSIASAPLSGLQRTQAHALGVYDAGAGAFEGAGYSFGILGTHEERAAWAMRTAAATVEGIKRFASAPGDALSGWLDDLTGNDPMAIRQATAQGAGIAMSVGGGFVLGRLQAAPLGGVHRTLAVGDVYSSDFVGPVKWDYFYRGDSTIRTEFLSSMAQSHGVRSAESFLSTRSTGALGDILAEHGISSSSSPFVSTSRNPQVAEYFARGPSQTQDGVLTSFRVESREAAALMQNGRLIQNVENPMSFFEPNPLIGLPEAEFLFGPNINPRYIYQQVPVRGIR